MLAFAMHCIVVSLFFVTTCECLSCNAEVYTNSGSPSNFLFVNFGTVMMLTKTPLPKKFKPPALILEKDV